MWRCDVLSLLPGDNLKNRNVLLQAGSREVTAVHGSNLWPSQLPEFEELLRKYFQACLHLGQALMQGALCLTPGGSRSTLAWQQDSPTPQNSNSQSFSSRQNGVHFTLWYKIPVQPAQRLSPWLPLHARCGNLNPHAGIAIGLGLPEDFFEKPGCGGTTAETSYWVARVLHYPPLSQGSSHQADKAALAAKVSLDLRILCRILQNGLTVWDSRTYLGFPGEVPKEEKELPQECEPS